MIFRKQISWTIPLVLLADLLAIAPTLRYSVAATTKGDAVEVRAVSDSKEQYERDVDMVAMDSQRQAINKLSNLLKKYRNTSQEPVLLAKLAELQQQQASILFRIAHGQAHHSGKAIDLSKYKTLEKQAITTLSTLIAKYPSYSEIPHAYFLRGKSQEELENKGEATKDYLFLVQHYPLAEEATSAYMSLADFAIDDNKHAVAIGYLKEVEKHPEDNHYPFALYKMAWSYYNLKDIPQALKYAEKQIHYYDDLEKTPQENGDLGLNSSDTALRDNTLLDVAVFYFEGYEESQDTYPPQKAFDYFRGLNKSNTIGKVLIRYAKLLRTHEHDRDLIAWKDIVLKAELDRQFHCNETLDVVMVTFERILNKRDYVALTDVAQNIVTLYKLQKSNKNLAFESTPKAQKQLLDTADGLQQLIIKNKESQQAKDLSQTLAKLYFDFTEIVDDSDPRVPGAHYNLAETLFSIRDFDAATTNYRWIVDHGSWKKKDKDRVSVADASLKAIASRYEVLQTRGQLPKEIKPVPLAENTNEPLDPQLAEWIQWIDIHVKHSEAGTENFVFEANRALYFHHHIIEAAKRMNEFAESHPNSTFAIPSASLVVDTLIATADWNALIKKTAEYMDVAEWKKLPFHERLYAASADASYKLIEVQAKSKNYPETLKAADRFIEKYPKSERFTDALVLAGATAMESQQPDLAVKYFTRIINEAPNSSSVRDALLARASIEENRYALSEASRDYRAYIALPAPKDSKDASKDAEKKLALQKKILAYSWINGDWVELKSQIETKDFCIGDLAEACEKYQALGIILRPELFKMDVETAFKKTKKAEGATAALWGAVSLTMNKDLEFRDRLTAIRHVAKYWDDLDPSVKFAILPSLNETIVEALELNRKMMNDFAPLRADEKYITARVDIMRLTENAVTLVMKMPWARIKALTLNSMAQVYIDFSTTLASLHPHGLSGNEITAYQDTIRKITVPFDEKGQDMRSKAFQLASHYAIESDAFQLIATPFFNDNPSQAKVLKKNLADSQEEMKSKENPAPVPAPSAAGTSGTVGKIVAKAAPVRKPVVAPAMELNLDFLDAVDPSEHWKKLIALPKPSDPTTQHLQHQFESAVQDKNWPKISYFLQESNEKKSFSPTVLSAMKVVSLSTAGAQAEALIELDDTHSKWDDQAKLIVLGTLSHHFEQSYAIDRAQSFNKEIEVLTAPAPTPSASPSGTASGAAQVVPQKKTQK